MNCQRIVQLTFAFIIALMATQNKSFAQVASAAPPSGSKAMPPTIFTGSVLDLLGKERKDVPVEVSVFFQNKGLPIDAFDSKNPSIMAGTPVYDQKTAKFFLPIRMADIPARDAGISLQFKVQGEVTAEVNFLSAFNSLVLNVIAPNPKPKTQCCCGRTGFFHRRD